MRPGKYAYFTVALLTGLLIVYKSLDYWSPQFEHGFLSDKEHIFNIYRIFLYAHMLAGPVALFTGLFQFTWQQHRYHQLVGKLYVFSILCFAAPAGLYMACYAADGFWSISNFVILAILWFLFTWRAFQFAKSGQYARHRRWMIRSFILTNSAVLLRVFSFIANYWQLTDPVTGYIIIGWVSWLPALCVYELYVFLKFKT